MKKDDKEERISKKYGLARKEKVKNPCKIP
jgi:hypothetical protein